MFRKSIRTSFLFRKTFLSTTPRNSKHNVAIIGAAGGIGQPLSLLLKLNPNIGELRLHDLKDVPGVAADLSHIETAVSVSHADGKDYCSTLKGADIIVVPAGMPRKPGMKREDLFNTNAQVVYDVAKGMAEHSPEAILIIITNPVNAVVPIACEVLKEAGKLNPRKIFGCSTLDSVRANTFVAGIIGADPKTVNVPVIGGHSGITIIPVLSRSTPPACIEGDQLSKLIKRVQDAGTEVVKAKAGKGSATLSMAYAASRLTFSILRALDGEANIVESAYVLSDVLPEVKYLATQLVLGKCGIEKNLGLGKLSDAEQKMVCDALGPLKKEIAMGEKFAQDQMCGGKKK